MEASRAKAAIRVSAVFMVDSWLGVVFMITLIGRIDALSIPYWGAFVGRVVRHF